MTRPGVERRAVALCLAGAASLAGLAWPGRKEAARRARRRAYWPWVETRPAGSTAVDLRVKVCDPDAMITSVAVLWGVRSGVIAVRFCLRGDESGEAGVVSGPRQSYRRPGRYRLAVTASSARCPGGGDAQEGRPLHRTIRVGRSGADRSAR